MMTVRRWMLGIGVVWLAAACTGNADATEVSTTTIPTTTTSSSSSTTSTTVIDGDAILNGFVVAVTDPDAIGTADMKVTVDVAGMSVESTGRMRFSGADTHVALEMEFLDERSEEITVDGDVFAKDGDGPWLAVEATSVDGANAVEGPGSDTLAFLSTLSSLEYVGRETLDGVELHRLGTPVDFEFEPVLLGFDIPADDVSGFEQSFLVDADGVPVRWDMRFEADIFNALVGREAVTTFVMEILFYDWGTEQHIAAPVDYWVPYESGQFGYAAAHPSKWRVDEEPGDEEFAPYDLLLGPLGDEIHVVAYLLDEPDLEPLGAWLGDFRSGVTDDWGASFDAPPHDVEVVGTWSPIQAFTYPDEESGRIHGIYVVTQPSLDVVYEFIWFSGIGNHKGDEDRFREFLATFQPGPTGSGGVSLYTLDVGDCYDDVSGTEGVGFVEPRGCDEPHDYENFATLTMVQDTWPGVSGTNDWADTACNDEFEAYTGSSYEESGLDFGWASPTGETWQVGDRTVICALWDLGGDKLSKSMRSGSAG
jgi:hypothetical protein